VCVSVSVNVCVRVVNYKLAVCVVCVCVRVGGKPRTCCIFVLAVYTIVGVSARGMYKCRWHLVISVHGVNAVSRYQIVPEEFVPRSVSRGSAVAQDRCAVRSGQPIG